MMKSVSCTGKNGVRPWLFLLFFALSAFAAHAQLPTDFRSEQIFLSPAKTAWNLGDTIGVEGAVTCLANDKGLPHSSYLYLELIDGAEDSVLVRQKVSCKEAGHFKVQLPTDLASRPGIYYLRAYTNLMRNFSDESFALQPVLLGKDFPKRMAIVDDNVQCTIVQSGGLLVCGGVQSVTAQLTSGDGTPLEAVPLSLLSYSGDTLAVDKTSAAGLASFSFMPQADTHYYLALETNALRKKFSLPLADAAAMKVQGTLRSGQLRYEILNPAGKPLTDCRLYLYNRADGISSVPLARPNGIVRLSKGASPVTLFLTDQADSILSQCTLADRYQLAQQLQLPDTLHLGDSISLPTAAAGSGVTARLVPDGERWMPRAEQALLFEADYASPIPFPSEMFSDDYAERDADLRAWMQTATFKRFSLKEALAKDTLIYRYMPETAMTFSGVAKDDYKLPLKKSTLVAYNTTNDFVYDVPMDTQGRFRMAVDDYEEGTTFFLQSLNVKGKPVMAHFTMDDVTFPPVTISKRYSLSSTYASDSEVTLGHIYDKHILPEVTVKARLRHEKPRNSKHFYKNTYVDRESIEERNYGTLLHILRAMPGIRVIRLEDDDTKKREANPFGRWFISTTRGSSLLKGSGVKLLVDGFAVEDVDLALDRPAEEIESVELLRPYEALAYTSFAIDGAIMVKTRTGRKEKAQSKGTYYTPLGLAPVAKVDRPLRAEREGTFRLLVDVVDRGTVRSFEHRVVVVK